MRSARFFAKKVSDIMPKSSLQVPNDSKTFYVGSPNSEPKQLPEGFLKLIAAQERREREKEMLKKTSDATIAKPSAYGSTAIPVPRKAAL